MGAMARALGVRLSKPGVYQLNPQGRPPQAGDMQRALALAGRVVGAQALCALLLALGLAVIPRNRLDGARGLCPWLM